MLGFSKENIFAFFLWLLLSRLPLSPVNPFSWISWDILSCQKCDILVCHHVWPSGLGWDRCESLRPSPLVRCSLPLSERHESHAGALEIPHLCPCCWQESQSAHESRNEIIKSRLAYQPSWPITDLYLNWKGSILGRQGSSWPPEPWCSARATAVQRLIPGQWTPCHAWEGSSSAQHHTSCQKGKGRELE